jgi:hypothetical protein
VKTFHDLEQFVSTASKGLDMGARMTSASTMQWNLAPKCQNPVYREFNARPRPAGMKPWQHTVRDIEGRRDIELDTRCRKCPPCLRLRAAYWRLRAQSELSSTKGRTWFGTLTLSPESHFQMLCRASLRLAERGETFEGLEAGRQFAERHREISRELTLWVKRVRKESGVPLRYCLVAEAHKSGLPHYHILVHEGSPDRPLRASTLRSQWKLGFTKFNLVAEDGEAKSAAYVTKYLAKSAIARVRASQGYGLASQTETVSDHSRTKERREPPLTPKATRERETNARASAPACCTAEGVSAAIGTVQ